MDILNTKKMKCIIQKLYEVYYPKVMDELVQSGVSQDEAKQYTTGILSKVYDKVMKEDTASPEEVHRIAVTLINTELEEILLPIFVQRYSGESDKGNTTADIDKEEMELEYVDLRADTMATVVEKQVVRRVVEPQICRRKINWVLVVCLSVVFAVICWTIIGMLMSSKIIPRVDFGYTWFNKYIWNVF